MRLIAKIVNRTLSLLARMLICGYQHMLSPIMRFFAFAPSPCRFQPTCSHYALEAFRTHSFFAAFSLSLRRIMRCHPFANGGYDPVPPPTAAPASAPAPDRPADANAGEIPPAPRPGCN